MTMIRDVLRLLGPKAKPRLALLFVLMVIGAGFEALGIGLVLPFLNLLNEPEAALQSPQLAWLHRTLGSPSPTGMLMWWGLGLLVLFGVKNLFLAGMQYYKFKFTFDQQVELKERMFSLYMRSPYISHLDRNSADLLRNVTEEVRKVFTYVVISGLSLFVEAFVVIALITLLFVVEPVVAPLAVGAFLLIGGTFFLVIRRRAQELGQDQVEHAGLLIRWVNQGLGSLKETKIRGCEDFFIDRVVNSASKCARAMRYHEFVRQLPQQVIETLGVGAMMILVLALLWRGDDMSSILPTLGLFALAAVRLMPSATRIISALTSIRVQGPSLRTLAEDYDRLVGPVDAARRASGPAVVMESGISVENLTFRFPSADRQTLQDVTLQIPKGKCVGLVGTSGAGKTTLVDVILGLLDPDAGAVKVDGRDIRENLDEWQRSVGYISQPVYLMDDSLRANVALGVERGEIDDERVWECLEAAQLADFVRNELPNGLDTVIGENGTRFSGGQRQRIGIARALYHNPSVLVLDEATSALDSETEGEITRAVNSLRGERTIIVIAHRFSTISDCDEVHVLDQGQLVASGRFDELLERDARFQRLAGIRPDRANGRRVAFPGVPG